MYAHVPDIGFIICITDFMQTIQYAMCDKNEAKEKV